MYGGFVQIGGGFILIYAFSKATNYDLVRVNALKGVIATIFIFVSIIIFALNGKINWPVAAAFTCGTLVGGFLGASFQVKKGDVWIRRILMIMGVSMAVKLIWSTL